jgi:excisionase family DNA binding protein
VNDRAIGQVRGVLAESVVLSTALDPFLSMKAASEYTGLSVRTLRTYLEMAPDEALPCYRLPGKILVRRSELDAWLRQFRSRGRPSLTRALAAVGLAHRDD